MTYKVAEKFKSIQGEGVYAGTPMAFIRFVGCSVGKRICQHCDTDFDKTYPWRGGGEFTAMDLAKWADDYAHVCLTGGEPLNQQLDEVLELVGSGRQIHIETSGTVPLSTRLQALHVHHPELLYICVSPKPGFLSRMIEEADELKLIVPGLGDMTDRLRSDLLHERRVQTTADLEDAANAFNLYWPTIYDALRWSTQYPDKPIFLQPRNSKFALDKNNLVIVQDLLREYPQFRLSLQLHKLLEVQ